MFIGAYFLFAFVQPFGDEKFGLSLITSAISGVHILYASILYYFIKRNAPQYGALASLMIPTLVTIATIQVTGGFGSPWMAVWLLLTAFSGMFGIAVAGFYAFMISVYFAMAAVGGLGFEINLIQSAIYVLATYLVSILSWLFWRRFYIGEQHNEKTIKLRGELKAEQLKSDILLNSITDGVMVIDSNGVISLMNPAAGTITGWPYEDGLNLQYQSILKFVHTENNKETPNDPANHPFAKALSTGKSFRDSNATLVTKDDNRVSLSIVASPIADSKGTVSGAVAVFRDVSKEKAEERRKAEFISTASHEMRTPVAAIEGYLSLALNDKVSKVDEKARSYLVKAHESTQHLGQLFKDLLTAAKSEDGRLVNNPEVVEMGEFLDRLAEDLRFSAEEKKLQFKFVVAGDESGGSMVRPLCYTLVDPERMREVITNLVSNAIKFTAQGGVTLGLRAEPDFLQISIRDTGFGIPKEDIPHLFQKFYRVDNSNTRTVGGTGLGLYISRSIIELYKGKIWVESEEGKGSTFYINLPRMSESEAKAAEQKQAKPPEAGAS